MSITPSIQKKSFTLADFAAIERNLCRPLGKMPVSEPGQPTTLDAIFQGANQAFLKRDMWGQAERTAWKTRHAELLVQQLGKPSKKEPTNEKYRKWIETVCGKLHSVQMMPLRVLQIQLLSQLLDPEIRMECKFLGAANSDGEITSFSGLLSEIFSSIQLIFAGLEHSLIVEPKQELQGLEGVISIIKRLDAQFNSISSDIPESTKNKIATIQSDLNMLRETLENKGAQFHLLLAPLGQYHFDSEESADFLRGIKKQSFILSHSIDLMEKDLNRHLKDVPKDKRLVKLEASIKEMLSEIKKAALTLGESGALAYVIQQPNARNASQIDSIASAFRKSFEDVNAYKKIYDEKTSEVRKKIVDWKQICQKRGVPNEKIPFGEGYQTEFETSVAYLHHTLIACGYLDLQVQLQNYGSIAQFQKILAELCRGHFEVESNYLSTRELLVYALYRLIGKLEDKINPEHFRILFGANMEIEGALEELVDLKRQREMDQIKTMINIMQACVEEIAEKDPSLCQLPELIAFNKFINAIGPWFLGIEGKYKNKIDALAFALSLKSGPELNFPVKLAHEILVLTQFFNVQIHEVFKLWIEQIAKGDKFGLVGFLRLKQIIVNLSLKFLEWNKVVNETVLMANNDQFIHYVSECQSWQQAADELNDEVLNQIWSSLEMWIDRQPDAEAKQWLEETRNCFLTHRFLVQSQTQFTNSPLISWGAPYLLGDKVEETSRIEPPGWDLTISDDEEEDPILPRPQAAQPRVVDRFDEIEWALRDALPKLNANCHSDHIKAILPILREEFYSANPPSFSHTQMLFFHSAILVEQTLKHLLLEQGKLTPELASIHSISALLKALEKQFDEKDTLSLSSLENLYLGGRYLSFAYGEEAAILRGARKNSKKAIEQAHQKIIQVLRIVYGSLSDQPIPKSKDQKPLSIQAPKLAPTEPVKIAQTVLPTLNRLQSSIYQHHASIRQPLSFGNTSGDRRINEQRKKKIAHALEHSSDYLKAIDELLPQACNPHACYGRSNALLLNTTLLLEQSIFSLMAYLDIPSDADPDMHALFETIERGGNPRPRSYDHNVKDLLSVIENHIEKTPSLSHLGLLPAERAAIHDLRNFIGGASRYLSDSHGTVADILKNLQHQSELHFSLEIDTSKLEREKWKSEVAEEITDIQSKAIYPLVTHALRAVQKIMQYNLDLRNGTSQLARRNTQEEEKQ
jgi:HEPN domain-containing protein